MSSGIDDTMRRVAMAMANGEKVKKADLFVAYQEWGIPAVNNQGKIAYKKGAQYFGKPIHDWQIEWLANASSNDGTTPLSTLATSIQGIPELKKANIGTAIRADWISGLKSEKTRQYFATLSSFNKPGSGAPATESTKAATVENILVSPIQENAILLSIADDLLRKHRQLSGKTKAPALLEAAVATNPCSLTAEQDRIVSAGEKYLRTFFSGVVRYLEKVGVIGSSLRGYIKLANTLTAAAEYILLVASLQATVGVDSLPLVRTKKTSSPGEKKILSIDARFEPGGATMANCWRLFFASSGLKGVKVPVSGPATGLDVLVAGRQGFDETSTDAFVQFRGNPTKLRTDSKGHTEIPVEGRPQKRAVADTAPSLSQTATVSVQIRVVELKLIKDLTSAASTLISPNIAKIAIEVLKRAYRVPFLYSFPVTDWKGGRVFSIDVTRDWYSGPPFISPNGGGAGGGDWTMTGGKLSVKGDIACIPSSTIGEAWICAGDASVSGSGEVRHYPDVDKLDCVGPWEVNNRVVSLLGYRYEGQSLDQIELSSEITQPGSASSSCNSKPPGAPTFIIPLPDQGKKHQGRFESYEDQHGHNYLDGTVTSKD
ncbi:hypothetical protein ACGFY7_49170 [Streptomyces prunicolor]|uniref:hypothetical protein n=1 Tax=Streptomyces prunicolor TaxID=67348 RepID=UPI00371D12C8